MHAEQPISFEPLSHLLLRLSRRRNVLRRKDERHGKCSIDRSVSFCFRYGSTTRSPIPLAIFRHDNKYDARISRKEFNIEKKKKILETFRIFTRNFAPDFLERAKLSRRRRGRKGRDTRLDSSRSSARRSNNSDWNPRNRGSIERFSIKGRNKVSFYRWWWSSRVAPPRHGITLLHINESGPSAHKIRTNER